MDESDRQPLPAEERRESRDRRAEVPTHAQLETCRNGARPDF
jgi:hypothetical protein